MEIQPMHPNPNQSDEETVLPPTPIVYESEEYHWEYKHLQLNVDEQEALGEDRLNELGQEGWELTGLFCHKNVLHYYFKRSVSTN